MAETVRHVTRTVQRDWPESCFGARNCDELVSVFSRKFLVTVSVTRFWYQFLVRESPALGRWNRLCPRSRHLEASTVTTELLYSRPDMVRLVRWR